MDRPLPTGAPVTRIALLHTASGGPDMPRSSSQGIRRAVFGYRRGAVSQLLVERDEMQRAAESAILGAEARVRELEAELEEVRRGIDLRDAQVRQMEAELEELERTAT